MATDAQMIANRANALKSTGPRTDEGKERSSSNAVRHGLTATKLSDELTLSESFLQRYENFTEEFHPRTPHQEMAIRQAVGASVQADIAQEMLFKENDRLKGMAFNSWDETRRHEAEKLMRKLHRRPGEIVAELTLTKAGCLVLIKAWEQLKQSSEEVGAWNDDEVSYALDLLGVALVHRHASSEARPKASDDLPTDQQKLCDREIARLNASLANGIEANDESERQRHLKGRTCPVTHKTLLLLRYQTEAARRSMQIISETFLEAAPKSKSSDKLKKPLPIVLGPPAASPSSPPAQPVEPPFCRLAPFLNPDETAPNPALQTLPDYAIRTLIGFRAELRRGEQIAVANGFDREETKHLLNDIIANFWGDVERVLTTHRLGLADVDPALYDFIGQFIDGE